MFLAKIKENNLYKLIGTDNYDIKYLNKAINMYNNCRYLEIGTAYGGSLSSVIDSLMNKNATIDSVDYFGKLLDTLPHVGPDLKGKKERHEWTKSIIETIGVSNSVKLYTCGSNEYFNLLNNTKKFDVIFIDGDHSYRQSKLDLDNSLKHLDDNGIIIMDDIKLNTQGLDKYNSVYRTFEEYDGRKELYKDMGIIYGKNNKINFLD